MIKFLDLEKQLTPVPDSSAPQEPTSKYQGADPATPSELPVQRAAAGSPYEVCVDGPLTYFRYYFEEVASAPALPSSNKPRIGVIPLSTGLVGAGIMVASAAAGFTAVKSMQDVTLPQTKSRKANNQQNSTQTPRPTLSTPERIEPYQGQQKTQTTPFQQTSITTSRVETNLQRLSTNDRVQSTMPDRLAPAVTAAPSRPSKQLSTRSSQPVEARPTPKATVQQAELMLASRALPRVALTEPRVLPVPQPPSDRGASPKGLDKGAEVQTAQQPAQKTTEPAKPPALTFRFALRPASPESAENTSDNSKSLEAKKPVKADKTIALTDKTNDRASGTPTLSQVLNSLKGVQDFVNLPNIAPKGAAVRLLPLTSQVVSEVENATQVKQFSILRLGLPDYQTQWLQSSKAVSESASASALPAHGFIDYQRQVIVVLRN